jgi:PTH1 family peptidyl-tRNA hydrolase
MRRYGSRRLRRIVDAVEKGLILIIGLGNPGPEYRLTRHNAGYWLLDRLAEAAATAFRLETKFHGMTCEITADERRVRLLKPTTYMNHSGQAVAATARYFDIPPTRILIAHDELDLPVGRVRLKFGGGHGGHNGLRDSMSALGSGNFWRLRIGIDHPEHKDDVIRYVLGQPSKSDAAAISDALGLVSEHMQSLVDGHFQLVMNRLHAMT